MGGKVGIRSQVLGGASCNEDTVPGVAGAVMSMQSVSRTPLLFQVRGAGWGGAGPWWWL